MTETHPDALTQLQQARAEGKLLHDPDMPHAAKALAAEHGLFTVTEPRHPISLRTYLGIADQNRAYSTIADNLTETMADVPEFAEAAWEGTLGASLADAFGAITFVDAQDVHFHWDRNRLEDMMAVSSEAEARRLAAAFQGLLRKPRGIYPVYIGRYKAGWPAVEVGDINEHTVRSIGRAVGALVAREDQAAGIVLPPTKWPLEEWKRLLGETFPPQLDQRLTAANEGYRNLGRVAAYRYGHDIYPLARTRLIGTDAAPVFQTMRDIMNGLIWTIRGKYPANLEQHPNKNQRLLIELGVELTREAAEPGQKRLGPPSSRTLSTGEKALAYGRTRLNHARSHPLPVALELASTAFSGVPELVINGIRYGAEVALASRQLLRDTQAYYQAKETAEAAGGSLDLLVARLR